MSQSDKQCVLFAGGGTGGHLFPLVAVAEALQKQQPDVRVVFAGTKDRLEATVIPALGYPFYAVTVEGFNKKGGFKRILIVLIKLMAGFFQGIKIILNEKPQAVVAAGAYVSAPIVLAAKFMSVKIVLLEQNSYPGLTIRLLERFADELHLSFENAAKYLKHPAKHKLSGNPVRAMKSLEDREKSAELFGVGGETIVLFLGGSLGAKTMNEALKAILPGLQEKKIAVIWQTGKLYYENFKEFAGNNITVVPFIENMAAAYSAADIIITRAGATTLAELAIVGKPVIMVPSPNVADNHQFANASTFVKEGAGVLIEDKNLGTELLPAIAVLASDKSGRQKMSERIIALAKPEAAETVAQSVVQLMKNY